MKLKSFILLCFSMGLCMQCAPLNSQTLEPVLLSNVPFEKNHGNTCASSSMTMMIQYAGIPMEWSQVFAISGGGELDSVIAFDGISSHLKDHYGYTFFRYDYATLLDVKRLIDHGYPVMPIQTFSHEDETGHNRVVIGYDEGTQEFILNDPSHYGAGYRMSYGDFQYFWDRWGEVGSWHAENILWILMKEDAVFPLFSAHSLLPVESPLDYLSVSGTIWATVSHITAMIQYAGVNITPREVYGLLGDPPVLNYGAVDQYLQEHHGLSFTRYDNITFDEVLLNIDQGRPVMILQCFYPGGTFGNNRLVIGRVPGEEAIIIRDAGLNSTGHQILTRGECEALWEEFHGLGYGWPERFFWVVQ